MHAPSSKVIEPLLLSDAAAKYGSSWSCTLVCTCFTSVFISVEMLSLLMCNDSVSFSLCVCVGERESFRDGGISLHHFQSACWPVMGWEWERKGTFPDKELSQCKDSCHPAWLPVNDFPPSSLCLSSIPSCLSPLPHSIFSPSPFPPSLSRVPLLLVNCDVISLRPTVI